MGSIPSFPFLSNIGFPLGMHPTMGVIPPTMGIIPPPRFVLPPGLSYGFPSGLPSYPMVGFPCIPPSASTRPIRPIGRFMPIANPVTLVSVGKKKAKVLRAPKKKSTAFKVKSPEQIALKCARTACREQVEKWREESVPQICNIVTE
jgi:hypothetical protein